MLKCLRAIIFKSTKELTVEGHLIILGMAEISKYAKLSSMFLRGKRDRMNRRYLIEKMFLPIRRHASRTCDRYVHIEMRIVNP